MSEAYDDFPDRLLVLMGNVTSAMNDMARAQIKTMAALVEMPQAIATGDDAALRAAVDEALDALEAANRRVGENLEQAHSLIEERRDTLAGKQDRLREEMERLLAERRKIMEKLENRDDA